MTITFCWLVFESSVATEFRSVCRFRSTAATTLLRSFLRCRRTTCFFLELKKLLGPLRAGQIIQQRLTRSFEARWRRGPRRTLLGFRHRTTFFVIQHIFRHCPPRWALWPSPSPSRRLLDGFGWGQQGCGWLWCLSGWLFRGGRACLASLATHDDDGDFQRVLLGAAATKRCQKGRGRPVVPLPCVPDNK